MRHSGIIVLFLHLGCKVTVPISTAPAYQEDLSVHRPKMDSTTVVSTELKTEEFIPLTNHIKAELDSIIKISIAQNKEEKLIDGFIIQVYTGNSRDKANQTWSQIDRNFPDLNPKVSYHQPNFRVKAGRFTNRLKAHRVFKEVKAKFPRALLVPERFTMTYE